jgi:hypothetical protein
MVTFDVVFANMQGLDIVEDALVVWNGRRAEVRVAACVSSYRFCSTSSLCASHCPRTKIWDALLPLVPSIQNLCLVLPAAIQVYTVEAKGVTTLSAFDIVATSMALFRTSIYACTVGGVAILNLQARGDVDNQRS